MYCHSYSLGFIYVIMKCYLNINVSTQLFDYNALAICTYNIASRTIASVTPDVIMATKFYITLVTWS